VEKQGHGFVTLLAKHGSGILTVGVGIPPKDRQALLRTAKNEAVARPLPRLSPREMTREAGFTPCQRQLGRDQTLAGQPSLRGVFE